jgi:hypothetical protein
LSDWVLVQTVLHSVEGGEQVLVQTPLLQNLEPVQTFPQVPQLLPSVLVLVQVEPHKVLPAEHAQTPFTQPWPLGHAWAQVPQFWLSDWVLVQVVPHSVLPPGQLVLQVPPEQA